MQRFLLPTLLFFACFMPQIVQAQDTPRRHRPLYLVLGRSSQRSGSSINYSQLTVEPVRSRSGKTPFVVGYYDEAYDFIGNSNTTDVTVRGRGVRVLWRPAIYQEYGFGVGHYSTNQTITDYTTIRSTRLSPPLNTYNINNAGIGGHLVARFYGSRHNFVELVQVYPGSSKQKTTILGLGLCF
jgi:hypothetical protein